MRDPKQSLWSIVVTLSVLGYLVYCQGDSFYFRTQPKDTNVINEHSTMLECEVSNTKHVITSWTLNGEHLQNTTRRYQNGSNLQITRVDREKDLGEFRCSATNVSTGFSISSTPASLNILWIDSEASVELVKPESKEVIKESDEVVLKCKADGTPELRWEWYRNSNRLFKSAKVNIRRKHLHLNDVSAHDNGIYSCRAVNEAGGVDSVINFALTIPHPEAAQIIQLPQDVTVRKNDPAWFHCVYKDAALTDWYNREDGPLSNNSRITVFPNGTLNVHRVRGSDEGLYKCVGTRGISKDEPVQTFIAELKIAVLDDPALEPSINQAVVAENGHFEVTCKRPLGHPKPRVWWEDHSSKVISDQGNIRVDDTRLLITSAKITDSGDYTCVAENLASIKKTSIRVTVSTRPTITSHPVNLNVEEGEMALFTCKFTGSPYPVTTVSWRKDKRPIHDSPPYISMPQNGTLLVSHVQLINNGTYVCEVTTGGFQPVYSKPATLFVKEKLKFAPVPVNKKLELNSPGKLYCKARGSTLPTINWFKEGLPHFQWPSHIRDENGTLFFDKVQEEDAGRYTCIATNSQGIINVTIQVEVIVSPKFVVQPANTEAYEGYPVLINCVAHGNPTPFIQWDKNSVPNGFDETRITVMENGSLFISEAHMSDHGKYGCTAGNSGGLKREEVSLVVRSGENMIFPNAGPGFGDGNQDENMMTKTVTITLGAAAAYMVLVVGLMMWCRYRRAKQKAAYLQQATAEAVNKTENGDAQHETELTEGRQVREYRDKNSDNEVQSHSSGGHSQHAKRNRMSYDKMQFPRHDLQTVMLLGKGNFGDVFLAKARAIVESEQETVVMVKALTAPEEGMDYHFKREIEMYHKMNHQRVAKLFGVCREADPQFMIMEYTDWGDLKQFLLATRKDNPRKSPRPPKLQLAQIVEMATQVVQGMEYLSSQRFIHRDLAARNCLVTSKLDVKISNASLSRDTYAREYATIKNKVVPLRWTAPEALFEEEYSMKSDVWSFAVLVWELFSQADLPHADKSDEVFLKLLKGGEIRWDVPRDHNCPESLRSLLATSWSHSPAERPPFNDICQEMQNVCLDTKV